MCLNQEFTTLTQKVQTLQQKMFDCTQDDYQNLEKLEKELARTLTQLISIRSTKEEVEKLLVEMLTKLHSEGALQLGLIT